jgi:tRNA(fMet)-specific endonuclease VapC
VKYCLDTNTIIYFLKGSFPAIAARLREKRPEDIFIPEMVLAELLYGANKSQQRQQNLKRIHAFLAPFNKLGFIGEAATHYADIRFALESSGQTIGPNDLIIAATTRAHGMVLVSYNTREFQRVEGLQVEDWTIGFQD